MNTSKNPFERKAPFKQSQSQKTPGFIKEFPVVDEAVARALERTCEKSDLNLAETVGRIGVGSREHTNFRMFLGNKVAQIAALSIPVKAAWAYDLEPTEWIRAGGIRLATGHRATGRRACG
ncbi:MAG TPA: hypothetical protein ENN13_04675 [Candidatus Altiarchaeales archaeon]|nr:hypothetical protein [Candidatus Altiarchaeales archaeon]